MLRTAFVNYRLLECVLQDGRGDCVMIDNDRFVRISLQLVRFEFKFSTRTRRLSAELTH